MSRSAIEWTGETWNPVRGCTRVSTGCENCYAERQAIRFAKAGEPYHELVRSTEAGPRWTGKVVLDEERLREPERWRKSRTVFVNSMSDLFHEALATQDIQRVLNVIAAHPLHTFQVLTKRPKRARDLFTLARREALPIPNLWLGTSIENAEETTRLIFLEQVKAAAVRFVSLEPLLGPVRLEHALTWLDWVIVGGESGPGARPCNPAWIREIVERCKGAGVPCFVKQLGSNVQEISHPSDVTAQEADRWMADGWTRVSDRRGEHWRRYYQLRDRKGGDPAEWPEDLRVRELPANAGVVPTW